MLKLVKVFFLILCLGACQSKTLYFSPQISGQVFDKTSNLPINEINHIWMNGGTVKVSDANGFFTAGPLQIDYRTRQPDIRMLQSLARKQRIEFIIDGYHKKTVDYSPFVTNTSFEKYEKINLGKVYLTPIDMPNPDKK